MMCKTCLGREVNNTPTKGVTNLVVCAGIINTLTITELNVFITFTAPTVHRVHTEETHFTS